MHHRPAVTALRASLTALGSDAHPEERVSEDELQSQVWHVVDDLRGLGWPAERVLIAMKAMAAEAGLKPSAHPMTGDDSIDARDAMLGKVISWCIQRYYVNAEKRSENSSD